MKNALQRMSSFRDTLEELLEKVEKMRSTLKSHVPPHVTPSAVELQAKDIMVHTICVCPGIDGSVRVGERVHVSEVVCTKRR